MGSNSDDSHKNSTKVVAVDMTDPQINAKLTAISAIVIVMLQQICDGPVEAYTVLHLAQEHLAREYDIAGIQNLPMPTTMKQ